MTRYIWDVVSDNVLMETDDAGETTAVYTQEPDRYGELISQHRDGKTNYYHYDGEGNTRAVTDENGDVVETATYSAFGEVVEKTSSIVNPFGYKGALGYYTNGDTNDIYVRARTYEPTIGRWLSVDPLGFPEGSNRFTYSLNSPISFSDPSGLSCCCCCAKSVTVQNVHRIETAQSYGHHFEVVLQMWHQRANWTPTGDCSFKWEELTDSPSPVMERLGCRPGEWCDITDSGSPNLRPWFNEREVVDCPNPEWVRLTDEPTARHSHVTQPGFPYPKLLRASPYRNLCIRISLESSPTCGCPDQKEIYILQQLRVQGTVKEERIVIVRGKPVKWYYWTWDPTILVQRLDVGLSKNDCEKAVGHPPSLP